MEKLSAFLYSYINPDEDLTAFVKCFKFRRIKKNGFYITPGKISDSIAFIKQGSFRVYYHDLKGKEITTWFSFEEMVITDMLAFYTGERASFYAQALEDCEVLMITKGQLETLYTLNPAYQEFGRKFAEEALIMLMQRTLSLHTKTPEERYLELIQQPEFMQKIPLKYMASYLGVTDTSLSGLRSRIR